MRGAPAQRCPGGAVAVVSPGSGWKHRHLDSSVPGPDNVARFRNVGAAKHQSLRLATGRVSSQDRGVVVGSHLILAANRHAGCLQRFAAGSMEANRRNASQEENGNELVGTTDA